jgi:NAD+ dependent glucose-6-phosphate dehydrogenase
MGRKVLLTGAGGRIGTAFRQFVQDRYALRLVDRDASKIQNATEHEVIEGNTADLALCQALCEDIDTVIHLAADPSPRADFYESLLDNNIKSVYNIFRAAKDQGCRRVVFASSIQVIEGYPLDVQPLPESPAKPMNMYAVGKLFGEATAHYFAYAEGLSSIAIRIGAFEHNRQIENPDGRTLSAFVSARDLSHLIVQSIEAPDDLMYAVLHGVSDNRFKRMDISSTRRLVGYTPEDDAFVRFGVGIPDNERWFEEAPRENRRKQ